VFHAPKFFFKSTFLRKFFSLYNHFFYASDELRMNHFMGNTVFNKSCHQGVTKRCRLSWLTNSALVCEPKCGGREGVAGLSQRVQQYTWSPNKLWRSNSIFNLYMPYKKKCRFQLFYVYFLKTNDKNIFSSAVRASYCTRILSGLSIHAQSHY